LPPETKTRPRRDVGASRDRDPHPVGGGGSSVIGLGAVGVGRGDSAVGSRNICDDVIRLIRDVTQRASYFEWVVLMEAACVADTTDRHPYTCVTAHNGEFIWGSHRVD
jgi:hypothetical protein